MYTQVIGAIVRHVLTAAFGFLGMSELMAGDQLTATVNALLFLGTIAWSVWQKFRARRAAEDPDHDGPTFIMIAMLLLPAAAVFLYIGSRAAEAHQAPTGWTYPLSCCSLHDCRMVPAKAVTAGPTGYVIGFTGEVVAYLDKKLRVSPDGAWHWCSKGGTDTGETICLFVPPPGS